jgi:hypothetical protein
MHNDQELSDQLGYNDIICKLSDHDDRCKEGDAEIRMLTSMDSASQGGFVFYVVFVKGKMYGHYFEDQEEQAIRAYMDGR